MIRVYALNGLIPLIGISTLLPQNWCGGQLFKDPYTRKDIRYQNWAPLLPFAQAAANKVITEAQKPGQKIFFGHSMGAEVLCLVLRMNPDISTEDNVFVLTGNPERKYGGMLTSPINIANPAYGGVGFPNDTPFRVWDVARQYDRYADFPTVNVRQAVANNEAGGGIHMNYTDVRVGDPNNARFVEGNVTYEFVPTFPMPSVVKPFKPLKRQALEDAQQRPTVEKGYTRPFQVPALTSIRAAGAVVDPYTGAAVRVASQPVWNPFT